MWLSQHSQIWGKQKRKTFICFKIKTLPLKFIYSRTFLILQESSARCACTKTYPEKKNNTFYLEFFVKKKKKKPKNQKTMQHFLGKHREHLRALLWNCKSAIKLTQKEEGTASNKNTQIKGSTSAAVFSKLEH